MGKREISKEDEFFKFISLWVAFNALLTDKYYAKIDKEQVVNFAIDEVNKARHNALLQQDTNYQQTVEILKESGIIDLKYGGRKRINRLRNLKEVVLCVYQVRNNLFHGGKSPSDPRDFRVVIASHYIVSKLIEPHLVSYVFA